MVAVRGLKPKLAEIGMILKVVEGRGASGTRAGSILGLLRFDRPGGCSDGGYGAGRAGAVGLWPGLKSGKLKAVAIKAFQTEFT
jgi:hypothetical protein